MDNNEELEQEKETDEVIETKETKDFGGVINERDRQAVNDLVKEIYSSYLDY